MSFKYFLASTFAKLRGIKTCIWVIGKDGNEETTQILSAILAKKFSVAISRVSQDLSNLSGPIFKSFGKNDKLIFQVEEIGSNLEKLAKDFPPTTIIINHLDFETPGGDIEFLQNLITQLHSKFGNSFQLLANFEDLKVRQLALNFPDNAVFFGISEKDCHVWASNIQTASFRLLFELNYGVERVAIDSALLGMHQIYPQLAASALAISLGFPLTTIKKTLEQIVPLKSKMEVISGYNGSVIVDDSAQMSFDSLMDAIDTLNYVSARKRFVLLSGFEGSASADKLSQEVGVKIYKDKIDYAFLVGPESKLIKEELIKLGMSPERIEHEPSPYQLTNKFLKLLSRGDVLLVKASSKYKVDELVTKLTKLR